MKIGELILHRFNGDEEFPIEKAEMMAYRTEDGVVLAFDVEAGHAEKTLPDSEKLTAMPNAEANVNLDALNASKLVGRILEVPRGCDEDGEWVGRLYYCEYEDLDDNKIQILARDHDSFHVLWTATTVDVIYYDETKLRAKAEIRAWFTFKDVGKWEKAEGA
jgi:hypothetical protein